MSSVCILDTSVFCALLRIPNMDQQHAEASRALRRFIGEGHSLLLPLAAIYETGNHVAQQGDGRQRRAAAERFVDQVSQALSGASPFSPTQIHQMEDVQDWLAGFPEDAMRGIGLGDRSIISVYEQQCRRNRARRVFIWSYDEHLRAYDRAP